MINNVLWQPQGQPLEQKMSRKQKPAEKILRLNFPNFCTSEYKKKQKKSTFDANGSFYCCKWFSREFCLNSKIIFWFLLNFQRINRALVIASTATSRISDKAVDNQLGIYIARSFGACLSVGTAWTHVLIELMYRITEELKNLIAEARLRIISCTGLWTWCVVHIFKPFSDAPCNPKKRHPVTPIAIPGPNGQKCLRDFDHTSPNLNPEKGLILSIQQVESACSACLNPGSATRKFLDV